MFMTRVVHLLGDWLFHRIIFDHIFPGPWVPLFCLGNRAGQDWRKWGTEGRRVMFRESRACVVPHILNRGFRVAQQPVPKLTVEFFRPNTQKERHTKKSRYKSKTGLQRVSRSLLLRMQLRHRKQWPDARVYPLERHAEHSRPDRGGRSSSRESGKGDDYLLRYQVG